MYIVWESDDTPGIWFAKFAEDDGTGTITTTGGIVGTGRSNDPPVAITAAIDNLNDLALLEAKKDGRK